MILKAGLRHHPEIMFVYRACMEEMNSRGLFNWNFGYPSPDIVSVDIEKGNLFIYQEHSTTIAAVCLNEESPPEYHAMRWQFESPALFVHRLGVHPAWRNRKIAGKMMDFAYEHAMKNGYKSIRLDVISQNPEANAIYKRAGYSEVGKIHFEYQEVKFTCMELKIP